MLQLIFLAFLMIAAYLITGLWRNTPKSFRGRIAISALFVFTAIGHFFKTDEMSQMLPSSIPMRNEIVYVTGVLELMGAIGILLFRFRVMAAWALMTFLACVLPANVYAALIHLDFGGHIYGMPYLLLRIPFQLFVIAWIYYFAIRLDKDPRLNARTSNAPAGLETRN
jgi:uncharacterized membrane protein